LGLNIGGEPAVPPPIDTIVAGDNFAAAGDVADAPLDIADSPEDNPGEE